MTEVAEAMARTDHVDRLTEETMLRTEQLGKVYRSRADRRDRTGGPSPRPAGKAEIAALVDFKVSVPAGEPVAILGPNGAGKSTLVKLLTGILRPTSGTAEVLGYVPWQQRRRLSYHIGTVFGHRSRLWPEFSVQQSLQLLGRIYDLPAATVRRRIGELAERLQALDLLARPARELSLGQRVRCDILAAVLHGPRLLVMDEPTIGLDLISKQQVRELFNTLREIDGTGLLVTSHDAGDIAAMCRRVLIIDHGRLVFDGDLASLQARYLDEIAVDLTYDATGGDPVWPEVPQARLDLVEPGRLRLLVDGRAGNVWQIVSAVAAGHTIMDVRISTPPLEHTLRRLFEELAAAGPRDEPAAAGRQRGEPTSRVARP